jgi:hypothetical protein
MGGAAFNRNPPLLPGAPPRHRPPPAGRNGAKSGFRSLRHGLLRATFAVLTFAIGFVAASSVAIGHHSVTMFDREHPIQLIGAVPEFKFVNPHASIILEVVGEDSLPVIRILKATTRTASSETVGRGRRSSPETSCALRSSRCATALAAVFGMLATPRTKTRGHW